MIDNLDQRIAYEGGWANWSESVNYNGSIMYLESDFFYKAVLWAVEENITKGLTDTTFGPTADCNRAQVVTFLYRTMAE